MWSRRLMIGRPHPGPLPSRLTPGLASLLAPALALAALGCGEGEESPTAPEFTAQTPVPALATATAGALSFRQVVAGATNTCGVTTDYRAYCWGGWWGAPTPRLVPGGLRFLEVSAGHEELTCGVTTNYRAYCWERNSVPTEVPGGRRFRQVSVGGGGRSGSYACGVTPTDVAFCWGINVYGRLGTGAGSTTTPVRVAGGLRFRRVHAAFSHTCGATTDNRAYCWGKDVFGQLGNGPPVHEVQPKPVAVAGGLRFRVVRPGSGYDAGINSQEFDTGLTCGVTVEDRAYCWGNGAVGSFGGSTTPVAVAGGRRYNFVHAGLFHACGLTIYDVAFCWGSNEFGQLGRLGSSSTTPVQVAGGLRFLGLTVGAIGQHTCGVTRDNRAYCWGQNGSGQLGDGTHTHRSTPVAVLGPAT
jgi:alpha-tubulin suppressor-like RCC1 family protein